MYVWMCFSTYILRLIQNINHKQHLCSKIMPSCFALHMQFMLMPIFWYFRNERVGSLEVDGMTLVEGKSPGLLNQLNTGDEIYIGTFTTLYSSSNASQRSTLTPKKSLVSRTSNFQRLLQLPKFTDLAVLLLVCIL